ncbi:hypothetical protein [Peterkaempfera griseoplana]|uniref:hypothetical protein n=1 Tax=Peterkaempfera griseoplana TaxID=66896 RepID=UPI0006E1279D|nr:hypothetical protein [Peterkaempfera griseoplana]
MRASALTDEEIAYLAEGAPEINTSELPPAEAFGPHAEEAARIYAELDSAVEAWAEFDAEWAELLDPNWRKIARARDKAAGAQARRQGKDPLEVPSVLDDWASKRDRIMGAAEVLVSEVNSAYMGLRAFALKHRDEILINVRVDFESAEAAYADAAAEMYRVRNKYGAALQRVYWAGAFGTGRQVGPYPNADSITPVGPGGSDLHDLYFTDRPPFPGAAEIKTVRSAIGDAVEGAFMVDAIDTETGERVRLSESSVRSTSGRYVRL